MTQWVNKPTEMQAPFALIGFKSTMPFDPKQSIFQYTSALPCLLLTNMDRIDIEHQICLTTFKKLQQQ